MKNQWKIHIILLACCLPLFSIAQLGSTKKSPAYYTFGLNAGFSYQSSDIRSTDEGFGLGLTFGRSIYYQPGAPISVEMRGRFLYARQYGLNPFRSYDIQNNPVLNGTIGLDYATYPAQFNEPRGFVYQNHRTDLAELGLEALFTLNRLRETTGIVASVYGGLGLDWYLTKTDQANGAGDAYYTGYAGLNENATRANIRNELRTKILDGNYENLADGFEDYGRLGIMPSLGFEIGYDVTPRFMVFGGHRITFSGTDLLDGQQWENPNKDLYHYTNFGLRWKIEPQRQVALLPEIDVTRPYHSPYSTQNGADGLVRADIRNVRNRMDLTCTLDGKEIPFDYAGSSFETGFPLRPGRNEVRITARNTAGTVSETVVIILEELIVQPPPSAEGPSIVITNPPYTDYRVDRPDYQIKAVITGVNSREDLEFYLGGERYRSFDFNLANGSFSANISLAAGRTPFRILARNNNGSAEESGALIREVIAQLPGVQIRQPSNNLETEADRTRLEATTTEVSDRNQVRVLVNGQNISNFSFNPNNGQITGDIDLQNGSNALEIIVQNNTGSASDRATVVKRTPQPAEPAPSVRIYNPDQNNIRTYEAGALLQASVQYVSRKSDISFEVNGINSNNFTFNPNNGQLSANIPLTDGNNNIRITAYNSSGSDAAEVNIFRERAVVNLNPPSVNINAPADNSETSRPDVEVRATTRNVSRKSDVNVSVNGQQVSNFSFNNYNGQIVASIPLAAGFNSIRIQVRNNDGVDEKSVSINYLQPLPPTIRMIRPRNGALSPDGRIEVQAIAQNISRMDQIGFYVNGQRTTRFNFSGARGEISTEVTLQPGNNNIRIQVQNADGRAEDQVNVVYNQTPAPIVRINRPVQNTQTDQALTQLEASVQNVVQKSDIQVRLNGSTVSNFGYSNNRVTADLRLSEGNNTIEVRAVNNTGSDASTVHVIYAPLQAPTVSITEPGTANAQSDVPQFTLRARTTGITQRNGVSLTVNGVNNDQFSWDPATGNLSLPLTLTEGDNRIRIQVQNTAGNGQAESTIRYDAPKIPVVSIETPADKSTVQEKNAQVRAKIRNVVGKRNVIFKVNGSLVTNFSLEGETFLADIQLSEGENQIGISARNSVGRDAKEVSVTYTPVAAPPAPEVTITSVSNPVINFQRPDYGVVSLVALTKNVANAGQLQLIIDGKSGNDFSFNPANQNFEANLVLKKGEPHTIVIEATTPAGTARATREISF